MVGSIESPYSIDEVMTLEDGTNVYGDAHDDYYEQLALVNSGYYNRNHHPPTPTFQTPQTTEIPQSNLSQSLHTARNESTPTVVSVPTNISFPSPTASTQASTTQTVNSAPVGIRRVAIQPTPRTTNITPTQTETVSVRSPDPPEDNDYINNANATASSTFLSYATASVASPPPLKTQANAPVSVASHSSISSNQQPAASAPPQPTYATESEVAMLRQQLEQLSETTNARINAIDTTVTNVATTVQTVQTDLQTLSQTIGNTVMNAVKAAMTPTVVPTPPPPQPIQVQQPIQAKPSTKTTTTESQLQSLLEKLDASQSSSKPIFTTFNQQNMEITKWKSTCLLALAANKSQYYNSFVTTNDNNERIFNTNISSSKNIHLFNMTYQALDQSKCNLEFISTSMINAADGLQLWNTIEERFKASQKNDFDKDDIKAEFKAMKKGQREKNTDFLTRVEKKISYLAINDIYPSATEQAVVLLEGLQSEYLADPVVQLRTGQSSVYSKWVKEGDLKHTLEKATMHIKAYKRILDKSNPAQSYRNMLLSNNNNNNTTTTSTSRVNQQQQDKSNEKTFVKRSDKFKQSLTDSTNKVRTILKWRDKKPDGCSLHPNAENNHKFFECNHVRNVCVECDAVQDLATAIASQGTGSRKKTENQDPPGARARRTVSAEELQSMVEARRSAQQNQSEAQDTSGFDNESEYDSEDTSSTRNNNNESVEGYLHSICNSDSCSTSTTSSILKEAGSINSPQTKRNVSFSPEVTKQQVLKSNQNVQYIPKDSKETKETAVADSGCTNDMSDNEEHFEYIIPLKRQKFVTLGDDKTQLLIKGYGIMNYLLNGKRIRKFGYYVPGLGVMLISIKQHIKYRGCYFHAEDDTVLLAYPKAVLYVTTDPEFTLRVQPARHLNTPYAFDEERAIFSTTSDKRKFHIMSTTKAKYITDKESQIKMSETVKVKKMINHAKLPVRSSKGAIGFDLFSSHDVNILPNQITKIHTGISMEIPKGIYLRIAARSSLALKGMSIEAGVIDNDYRGELIVLMRNHTKTTVKLRDGQRIAQGIFEQAKTPCLVIAENLSNTQRNKGAFGSTDKVYHKGNKEEAIACALRIAMKSNTQKMCDSMYSESTDEYAELMQSDNQINHTEGENKPTKSIYATQKYDASHNTENIPPILPQDRINSSVPKHITLSKDFIIQATGFHKSDFLLKHFNTISEKTVTISQVDKNPEIDEGEVATLHSRRKNKTLSETTHLKQGEVFNMDIVYGPTVAIAGIKYALILIDRKTKRKFIYGIKNLRESIQNALRQFITDIGTTPRLIRTDFDHRLIGGATRKMLLKKNIKIQAAPPRRQHQNGLIERHWQNIMTMARNWLKSQLLPSTFWFFAIKRAVEVSNILPVETKEGIIYTPYERAYNRKVDFRCLFPMFSKAYIKVAKEQGGGHLNKYKSQIIKVICVGKCPKSDSLLFYHPSSKTIISDSDGYKFDNFSPSGPQFDLKYDGGFTIAKKSTLPAHQKPSHEENDTAFIKRKKEYVKVTILQVPIEEENEPFIVQVQDTGTIEEIPSSELYESNPNAKPTDENQPVNSLYPWIRDKGKVTLYLSNHWKKPKQGFLQNINSEWYFVQGRTINSTSKPLHLPKFIENAESMIHNKKIFQGWKNSAGIINARISRCLSNIAASIITAKRHVSAKNLVEMKAPTSLLQHAKMCENDKQIWDQSYFEEYDGLRNVDTWEVITEKEYKDIKHLVKRTLPTMAIAVIKKDGEGRPVRAKYRIVALGNLDPHSWSKQDCFAPVLSQQELRLLLALAVRNRCVPKSGDVSQAFCQSHLPENEIYVCKPPAGCPITPPNSYWKLKKTLYGLKRSPRHWYEMAKKILLKIGLKQCQHAPCIFYGTIIEGEPPLYLGLYVDDFLFFSKSNQVEEKFQQEFAKHVPVSFDSEVNYFLGVKFNHKKYKDGHVEITMSQTAYIDELCKLTKLNGEAVNTPASPYHSGYPIDAIPQEEYDEIVQQRYTLQLQTIVGSLNWLSVSTRPNIATVTSLLAKYCRKPSKGHIDAALRVVRYLKGTKNLKLKFSSRDNNTMESFVKFPLPNSELVGLCDANWGPQDQSRPQEDKTPPELELFKTRSMSGFITWLNGPLMWISKRQTYTARSSAEAEIYATDECAKNILHLMNIIQDLDLTQELIQGPINIWNDNNACVCWSKNTTTKGLRHVQIRENAVREGVMMGLFKVSHIEGKNNPADIFTKEDKDTAHFVSIRNGIMSNKYNEEVEETNVEITGAQNSVQGTGGCQVGSSPSPSSSPH